MKIKARKIVKTTVLAASLGFAASIVGAAPVYTITLPSGATNTLSEAFSLGFVSSSEGTATKEGLLAAERLQITGGGRLEINEDLKTAGFKGEVHVLSGAVLRLTANGALGDTDHGTFVADGATLETECLDTTANNKLAFVNERLSFAGAGVDGRGALLALTPKMQERSGVWGGTYLTMTGDATVGTIGSFQDFPCLSPATGSLNMNGFTLTIKGIQSAAGTYPNPFCLRPLVVNPGHVVVEDCFVSMNNMADLGGTAENTLTLGQNATLELYESSALGKKPWTLRVAADNTSVTPIRTAKTGAVWDGPIVYEHKANFNVNPQEVKPDVFVNSTYLNGKITAKGDLSFGTSYPDLPISTLTLASPENDFRGTVSVSGVNLNLPVDGALPKTVSSFTLSKGAISVDRTMRPDGSLPKFELPVLKAEGPVTIQDGFVNFAGIDMLSGVTTFVEPTQDINAGLYEGVQRFAYWSGAAGYAANGVCDGDKNNATNAVTLGVRLAYETQTYDDKKVLNEKGEAVVPGGLAVSYQGYIWNSGSQNVTWTFAASEKSVSSLYINGVSVYGRQRTATTGDENVDSADLRYGNVVLKPGANSFWWRIGVVGNKVGPNASVKTCPTWTDPTKMGLVVDRQGRKSNDPANYERLTEIGDGALFTLTKPGTPEYEALIARNKQDLSILRGRPGTVLEARSRQLKVAKLEGCPTVNVLGNWRRETSGITVTEGIAVNAEDVAAGKVFETDGPLVFKSNVTASFLGNLKVLSSKAPYAIAKAAGGITGVPVPMVDGARRVKLSLSADGKTLLATVIPPGMMMVVR